MAKPCNEDGPGIGRLGNQESPALIGGREKVARIIDPSAFEDEAPHHQRVYRNMSLAEARADALAKADAIIALSSAKPGTVQEHEPVAWRYELATALMTDGTYSNWKQCLTEHKPNVPADSIRNLTPLYAAREHGPAQGLGDTLSPREAQLFDAAWHLVAAVNGGGPLPHKTVAERAQEATAVLLPLLDARNAPANPAAPEPSSTDTESAPKPGELRLFDGQLCRFIERELEGDKWEVIGLFPAPGSNTPAGEGEKLREALRLIADFVPDPDIDLPPHRQIAVYAKTIARQALASPAQPAVVPGGEGER